MPARVGEGGRAYVTTPPDCPTGTWISRATYEFEDGGSTSMTSERPCTRPPAASEANVRVAVTPRRVRTRTRRTFRVLVSSADPSCIRGARVRLGRRHARTGAHGRARLRTSFAHIGRKKLTVAPANAGCRKGSAAVKVVRR